ncbi:MAG: cytochrome c3 family protein [Deltaproteobacteria bacterium]|nr:cytochrome c3 family protein [Deltaproteobacteria bacterium]
MTQIFHRSANTLTILALAGVVAALAGVCLALYMTTWSNYKTGVGIDVQQPVPFSHRHHVRGAGLDCRYCHGGVETSAFAGIPPTHTCMTCHSQLFANSPVLKPVRDSFQNKIALQWNRVQRLPDFVYFAHDIHVGKGVGCSTCHGHVETMPLMREQNAFHMRDCLDCHREPERYLRPRDQVFNMSWEPPADQLAKGRELVREYGLQRAILTNCSTCHR